MARHDVARAATPRYGRTNAQKNSTSVSGVLRTSSVYTVANARSDGDGRDAHRGDERAEHERRRRRDTTSSSSVIAKPSR